MAKINDVALGVVMVTLILYQNTRPSAYVMFWEAVGRLIQKSQSIELKRNKVMNDTL